MSNLDMRAMRLETGAGAFPVRHAIIREELSTPTWATVELRVASDPGFGSMVDSDARLVFTVGGRAVRDVSLRVRSSKFLGHREGLLAFELDLRAAMWFLRLSKNTRKFRDQSTREIVSQVIGGRVPFRFEIVREPWSLPYVVQYEEIDFDFVSRLLEKEGIYYAIEDDGTVVFADQSSAADPFGPHGSLALITAQDALTHGEEALFALGRGTRVGTGRATVNDYHWKTPDLDLIQSVAGARDTALENYDYPTGYRLPDQGKTLARLRVESFEARKRYVSGETSFIMLRTNRSISIAHADGISFAGDYFLVSVTHEFRHASDDVTTLKNRFEATPLSIPFRPEIRTPRPEVGGYDTAMVRGPIGEEIHTDVYGRCKVQFHWDREAKGTDEDSRWLRVLQETSSSMTLARIGWEVAIQYLHSDPDRPIVIARMINGQMIPIYGQPAHQNVMVIRTESYPGKNGYNEIKIDDTSGAQKIYMRAQHQHLIVVEHDKREWVGHDETYTIEDNTSRRVDKHQTMHVGDDHKVRIGVDEGLTVESNRTETIGGNETVTVGGAIGLDVTKNEQEIVGALRMTIAGGITPPKPPNPLDALKSALPSAPKKPDLKELGQQALQNPAGAKESLGSSLKQSIPTPASLKESATSSLKKAVQPPSLKSLLSGQITRAVSGTLKKTVGGAMITLAGEGVSENVQKMLAEVIGGLRVLIGKNGDVANTSAGSFTRLIGGMVLKKAGKDVAHSAEESNVTIAGNAEMTAAEKLEVRGQTITIEAKKRAHLKKGDLSIELTPSKINIEGSLKLTSKDRIRIKGAPDNVTRD
ncbi:MAG: type VI secretion system tip protein VgrG [Polyangiaceae bacterium]|nr:type VI secretion system tip protein VgrG [Polyangiaceae bacterium]